ncbi:MAG: thiamine-phosphate kinase [Thermoplasmata archaeon]|nr:thiamine-phosphate kinase [Thermoplasmata archaeon]
MVRRASGRPRLFPEREFHRWLRTLVPSGGTGLLAMGDDVAALPLDRGRTLLLTTDALSEGTHFLGRSPADAVGAAAIHASLSDLAAKGGRPIAALLDLLLPPRTPMAWAQGVARGAQKAAAEFGIQLVGGDTKPSAGRSVVGTLVGIGSRQLAPRSAARPGDLLVTTGVVGQGGAAALPLTRTRRPATRELRELLRIRPRLEEGSALVRSVHAMLDTSDGILEASTLLAEASGVGVAIDWDRLPLDRRLHAAHLSPSTRLELAFFGGDYELLAALPARSLPSALRALRRIGTELTVVGQVEAGRGVRLLQDGTSRRMRSAGWDPFARPRPAPGRH